MPGGGGGEGGQKRTPPVIGARIIDTLKKKKKKSQDSVHILQILKRKESRSRFEPSSPAYASLTRPCLTLALRETKLAHLLLLLIAFFYIFFL